MNYPNDGELELRFTVPGKLACVADASRVVLDYLVDKLGDQKVATDVKIAVELCVTEAMTNIIRHAYKGKSDGWICIKAQMLKDIVKIVLEDFGAEIKGGQPARKSLQIESFELEDLPEGGFGWPLIYSEMDVVKYERIDKLNRLTLVKDIALTPVA